MYTYAYKHTHTRTHIHITTFMRGLGPSALRLLSSFLLSWFYLYSLDMLLATSPDSTLSFPLPTPLPQSSALYRTRGCWRVLFGATCTHAGDENVKCVHNFPTNTGVDMEKRDLWMSMLYEKKNYHWSCTLDSMCGPWTTSTGINKELVRNAEYQTSKQTC